MTTYEPGERECGCAWEYRSDNLGDTWQTYTRRCGPHATMCRGLEQWEIESAPPPVSIDRARRRVRAVVDHARPGSAGEVL